LLKENARLQSNLSSKNASNTQIECFKTKLRKEKLLNKWLNEEVHVQAIVISQLEDLLKDAKTMHLIINLKAVHFLINVQDRGLDLCGSL